jgi:hypothetical protein
VVEINNSQGWVQLKLELEPHPYLFCTTTTCHAPEFYISRNSTPESLAADLLEAPDVLHGSLVAQSHQLHCIVEGVVAAALQNKVHAPSPV